MVFEFDCPVLIHGLRNDRFKKYNNRIARIAKSESLTSKQTQQPLRVVQLLVASDDECDTFLCPEVNLLKIESPKDVKKHEFSNVPAVDKEDLALYMLANRNSTAVPDVGRVFSCSSKITDQVNA